MWGRNGGKGIVYGGRVRKVCMGGNGRMVGVRGGEDGELGVRSVKRSIRGWRRGMEVGEGGEVVGINERMWGGWGCREVIVWLGWGIRSGEWCR
jgi:hypothetical protein